MHKNSTDWENVGKWYNQIVGTHGHHYHQSIVIPGVLKLLNLVEGKTVNLLDLACGQGVLSRHLPAAASYVGVDAAAQLIKAAQSYQHKRPCKFVHADVIKPLALPPESFSHATLILAAQNIEFPLKVFENAFKYLQSKGTFVVVINHPCFRIPRQSSWQVDQANKMQFRRINRYMSNMKIPIQTHPSQGQNSPQTWSFHHPLMDYSRWLHEAGFVINLIEEWCSDKTSEGGAAKMENRSREEIPMFMAIAACKR